VDGDSVEATPDDVVLRIAKNMQGSHAKQTTGEPRKWRDVPVDEKGMWIRLSRTAVRLFSEAATENPHR
jgi:hypothetical protein